MNANAPFRLDAVTGETERPVLVAAAKHIAEALSMTSGTNWPVTLRFRAALSAVDPSDVPAVLIASLLPDLARDNEPWNRTEARWREELRSLQEHKIPAIFICTIFRHIASGSSAPTIERIRRLNLLSIHLSHDTGVNVIDIDRIFAHNGAAALQTDYRITGPVAMETAARFIASTVLAAPLDDVLPSAVQEQARQFHAARPPIVSSKTDSAKLRETAGRSNEID